MNRKNRSNKKKEYTQGISCTKSLHLMKYLTSGLLALLIFTNYASCQPISDSIRINERWCKYLLETTATDSIKPLVINLHGWTMDASLQRQISQMSSWARDEKATIVYPDAADKDFAWNPETDIDFIRRLIDHLKKTCLVDSNRIYLVGFSSGGFFTHYLANKLSGTISAAAIIEGGIRPEWQLGPPIYGIPILIIHNKFDTRTRYLDFGITAYQQWIDWNQSDTLAKTTIHCFDPFVSLKTHENGRDNSKVLFYSFDFKMGNGHTWPYKNMCGIDATNVIWDFFNRLDE